MVHLPNHPTQGGMVFMLNRLLEFAQPQRTNGCLLIFGIANRAFNPLNTKFRHFFLPLSPDYDVRRPPRRSPRSLRSPPPPRRSLSPGPAPPLRPDLALLSPTSSYRLAPAWPASSAPIPAPR